VVGFSRFLLCVSGQSTCGFRCLQQCRCWYLQVGVCLHTARRFVCGWYRGNSVLVVGGSSSVHTPSPSRFADALVPRWCSNVPSLESTTSVCWRTILKLHPYHCSNAVAKMWLYGGGVFICVGGVGLPDGECACAGFVAIRNWCRCIHHRVVASIRGARWV